MLRKRNPDLVSLNSIRSLNDSENHYRNLEGTDLSFRQKQVDNTESVQDYNAMRVTFNPEMCKRSKSKDTQVESPFHHGCSNWNSLKEFISMSIEKKWWGKLTSSHSLDQFKEDSKAEECQTFTAASRIIPYEAMMSPRRESMNLGQPRLSLPLINSNIDERSMN
jgi:hypothetical protein